MSAKTIRLIDKKHISPDSFLLTFRRSDEEAFEFVGGQYIILNCGIDEVESKPLKRAYSVLSSDAQKDSFRICVKRLENGRGSRRITDSEPGQEFEYSGPWGKFVGNPDWPLSGRNLIVGTDTGITSTLGILGSRKFFSLKNCTDAIWLKEDGDEFLSESILREYLPEPFSGLKIETIPKISDPERIPKALDLLGIFIQEIGIPRNVFLSGDGNVIRALQAELISLGVSESAIGTEAFFHTIRNISSGSQKA